MEIRQITAALRRRRLLTTLLVVIAVGAAVGIKFTMHSSQTGAASVQLLVDAPAPVIADFRQDANPLIARAPVLAQVMASSVIEKQIAAAAGVPVDDLSATGPFSGPGPGASASAGSSSGNSGSSAAAPVYRLDFSAQAQLPLISVNATAPTPAAAAKLADAVAPVVSGYLKQLSAVSPRLIPLNDRLVVRQLGTAQANPVSSGSATMMAGAAAIVILILGSLVILSVDRRRRRRDGQPGGSPVDSDTSIDGAGAGAAAQAMRSLDDWGADAYDSNGLTAGAFAGLIDTPGGKP